MIQTNYNIYILRHENFEEYEIKKETRWKTEKASVCFEIFFDEPLKRIATVLLQLLEGKPNRSQSRMGGN